MKVNILIPAAGLGSRFTQKEEYKSCSKPLIEVWRGQKMIDLVVENLLTGSRGYSVNFIFCVREDDVYNHLSSKYPDSRIIRVKELTRGPASTCLLAKEFINSKIPLIIANSDQYIHKFKLKRFLKFCKKYDAVLGTFFSQHPKNSYIKMNEENLVIEVKEKQVISNIATSGLHYWSCGEDFVNSAETMIREKDTVNNEYYVAPSYNYLQEDAKIGVYHFNEGFHWPIGTPEDLVKFKKEFEK